MTKATPPPPENLLTDLSSQVNIMSTEKEDEIHVPPAAAADGTLQETDQEEMEEDIEKVSPVLF